MLETRVRADYGVNLNIKHRCAHMPRHTNLSEAPALKTDV